LRPTTLSWNCIWFSAKLCTSGASEIAITKLQGESRQKRQQAGQQDRRDGACCRCKRQSTAKSRNIVQCYLQTEPVTGSLFTTCNCSMYCIVHHCIILAGTPAAFMQCTICGICGITIADTQAHKCAQAAAAAAAAGCKRHYMHARPGACTAHTSNS
jgi:hypothetical protein